MATNYVTVKSSDESYTKYLWGSFSETQLAIPIKSYNLGTKEESITFEIQDLKVIQRPPFLKFLSSLIKIRSFIIILFPLLYVTAINYGSPQFDEVSILLAAISAVILFAGFNIRNDVVDHVTGYDRVNIDSVKKPIRMGWISAKKAALLSNILVGLAALISVPTFLLHPQLLKILAVTLILFFLGRLVKNNSYKNRHFGELILFLLVGPVLTAGFQMACGSFLDAETLFFGFLWGAGVVYLVQINNFSHIMTSSQHGIKNTMTKLGFDLSQKFLILWWSLFLILWFFYQVVFAHSVLGWVGSAALVVMSILFFVNLLNIKSPMGSGLRKIKNRANYLFLLTVATLFLQCLERLKVFSF
ncbi:MAG: prenyltransferase [Pseudobdellovibrio sp.]